MKPILFNTEMVKAILEGRKTVTRRLVKEKIIIGFDYKCDGTPWYYRNEKEECWEVENVGPYQVGDVLYVRETWRCYSYNNMDGNLPFGVQYKADGEKNYFKMEDNERYEKFEKLAVKDTWQPSLFMPKEAARIFLRVKEVRIERLQGITEEQAVKEGISKMYDGTPDAEYEVWSKRVCQGKKKEEWPYTNYLWHGNFGSCGTGNKLSDAWKYQCSGYESAVDSFSSLWNTTVKLTDWNTYGWQANPWVWVIEFEMISKEEAYAECKR
jgi:hypothetical protein